MDGAMASRLVFPAAFAHRVDLDARAAALVEPTSVALHAVRRGDVAGKGVLVVGAGPIGLLVAQCARAEGAAAVLISDTRADRLDVAAALGLATYAGEAADPAVPDTAETAGALAAGAVAPGMVEPDGIDVAILCAGGPAAIDAAFAAVRPGGTRRRARALRRADDPVRLRRDGRPRRRPRRRARLGRLLAGRDRADHRRSRARPSRVVTSTFPLERTREALEHLVSPGTLKVLIEP